MRDSMRTSEVAAELIKNDATERPAYVVLFLRDGNGDVLSKKRFPVKAVFSHKDDATTIYIEQADCLQAEDLELQQQARIAKLEKALSDLIEVAYECDSWQSFPSRELDKAENALGG